MTLSVRCVHIFIHKILSVKVLDNHESVFATTLYVLLAVTSKSNRVGTENLAIKSSQKMKKLTT